MPASPVFVSWSIYLIGVLNRTCCIGPNFMVHFVLKVPYEPERVCLVQLGLNASDLIQKPLALLLNPPCNTRLFCGIRSHIT